MCGRVAAREDAEQQAEHVPGEEADDADPDGQGRPAGVGPEREAEPAVQQRRGRPATAAGRRGTRCSSDRLAPHPARPRGGQEPRAQRRGQRARRRLPEHPLDHELGADQAHRQSHTGDGATPDVQHVRDARGRVARAGTSRSAAACAPCRAPCRARPRSRARSRRARRPDGSPRARAGPGMPAQRADLVQVPVGVPLDASGPRPATGRPGTGRARTGSRARAAPRSGRSPWSARRTSTPTSGTRRPSGGVDAAGARGCPRSSSASRA